MLEPGNVCNLSCALCATGQREPTRTREMLLFENYRKLMDELGKYLTHLGLYNWGEPFLNKEIFKIIKYAKKYKVFVEVSSNLNFYNPRVGNQIIKSGIDRLILSIHGGSPETYSKYMVGGNFDNVISNLTSLIELKKRSDAKKPILCWRFVVFRHNQHEVEKTAKLAKEIGVEEFEPLPMKMDIGYNIEIIKRDIWARREWIPTKKEFKTYNIKKRELKEKVDCFWPWEIVSVGADGSVQPCCVFYDQKFDFGNVFKKPFKEVWNNRYYQISRKVLREKIKNNSQTICGLCLKSGFIAK